jgi:hypothetical protein
MIKKILAIYLLIILLCASNEALAIVLTVQDTSSTLKETIQVPVIVDDPQQIAGVALTVTYDTDNLQLLSVDGSFFDSFIIGDEISGVGTMICGANPEDGSLNPTLLILNFYVKDTAVYDYAISIIQSTIANTNAGYSAEGDTIPILMGADYSKDPTDPLAYPVLPISIVSGALSIDRDNDGLTDTEELALGTDINNPDTDGDGLNDGDEYNDPERDPKVKDNIFGATSATLTNVYVPMEPGDKLTYAGTGSWVGYSRYIETVATEVIDSVDCLKMLIKGHGNNPDPEQDPKWYYIWVAQDTDDVVLLLKIYDAQAEVTETYGKTDAKVWMPFNPVVGQKFRKIGDEYCEVIETGIDVPVMTTGLGPYENCLKLMWTDGISDVNYIFVAPDVGSVKEEWNDGDTNGWELEGDEPRMQALPWLMLLLGD